MNPAQMLLLQQVAANASRRSTGKSSVVGAAGTDPEPEGSGKTVAVLILCLLAVVAVGIILSVAKHNPL